MKKILLFIFSLCSKKINLSYETIEDRLLVYEILFKELIKENAPKAGLCEYCYRITGIYSTLHLPELNRYKPISIPNELPRYWYPLDYHGMKTRKIIVIETIKYTKNIIQFNSK